jgi:phosphoribosyl 1,2-cyclic phosphodiesterase
MNIQIWGARGSIASPGPTTLRYGGNSTCLEIRTREGQVVIVDAGSGLRLLGKKLIKEKDLSELYLLLTHAHWDHLSGFPFFLPAYFERYTINVYGGHKAQGSLKGYLSHNMAAPFFPVDFKLLKAKFQFDHPIPRAGNIHLLEFVPIPLSHPNGGYGFKFQKLGKIFVFLTDNELSFQHEGGLTRDEYVKWSHRADLLIHDAQYTNEEYQRTKGWGHSRFDEAVDLAIEAKVKRLGLFHHDPDRTDDDLDVQVRLCQERIARAGVPIECFAVAEGMEISL